MRAQRYVDGTLRCEDVSLEEIAQAAGTPVHVYSRQNLARNVEELTHAFRALQPLVCYSLKANANLTLCRLLANLGLGADVVSGGELHIALAGGFKPEQIVFAGAGKTETDIELALRSGIRMLNVESAPELEAIEAVARRLQVRAPTALRINPDVAANTHEYITTGTKETKFGVHPDEARRLYQHAQKSPWLQPVGIHMHIGSQIAEVTPYLRALDRMRPLLASLNHLGIDLELLDIGGGFSIPYHPGDQVLCLEALAQEIGPLVPKGMQLVIEPGRRIVGPAGLLVSRMLYAKEGRDKHFYIVDAGMNDLIRPTLYGASHELTPVHEDETGCRQEVDVVGPVCETGDFIARQVLLPPLEPGALLAISNTGAYGFSMSSTYNGRPLLAEVLVDGSRWHIIRQRGTYASLVSSGPAHLPRVEPEKKDAPGPLSFWKMEAAGNDFIICDNRSDFIKDGRRQALLMCDRKRGIGADGLILVEDSAQADFTMRIFNPDGSEAEMCGNGARCVARFAYLQGIAGKRCTFSTLAGLIEAEAGQKLVRIRVTDPSVIEEVNVPVVDGSRYHGYHVDTGVPHLVLFVEDVDDAPVETLGRELRFHDLFQPRGTNVDFVDVADGQIRVRTYERGVEAETLSCGTGSVASALVSAFACNLASPVSVTTRGGQVFVRFESQGRSFAKVMLEGEANIVYTGEYQ